MSIKCDQVHNKFRILYNYKQNAFAIFVEYKQANRSSIVYIDLHINYFMYTALSILLTTKL
jgi:hypothetical protein